MSGARKLQTEIDRVMKKVDEGVELFDEIWEKVYSAEQQNQKEKYEMDLKKEIKKLQRLRDQIKTWIGSSEVKDKDSLLEARRRIETKMEQFKVCEKETKTKTYSKEGLARAEKLDPAEEAKQKTTAWIREAVETLQQLVDDRELEIERLSAGKGKKTNKNIIEENNIFILNHKFHINKLEGIMRLVNNDVLDIDSVNDLKEDLEYYIEAHEEDEYIQAYDEEIFYDELGLDDLHVVNVDRVTHVDSSKRSKSSSSSVADDNDSSSRSSHKEKKSSKKSSSSGVIPITIGRARLTVSGSSADSKDSSKSMSNANTPVKSRGSNDHGRNGSNYHQNPSMSVPSLGPTPAKVPPPPQGASMATILKREQAIKRESEKQENERQQKAALQVQQQLLREQQARAQAEQMRQRQQEAMRQQELREQQALQQLAAQKRQQEEQVRQQKQAQQQAVAKQQLQMQAQQQAQQQKMHQSHQQKQLQASGGKGTLDKLLTSGLGGLVGNNENVVNGSTVDVVSPQEQAHAAANSVSYDATASYLGALNESFLHCPSTADSERQRSYTPRNPYPTPPSYPTTPSQIFDHAAIFEKLGPDCLFFIFYYAQGTYQQYLAARELKKQSWRYHKKYMTWFQRHEEPKVTTDEYEQGTYVYFDYETGWCQRIKSDFRFEYSYLEDSLKI